MEKASAIAALVTKARCEFMSLCGPHNHIPTNNMGIIIIKSRAIKVAKEIIHGDDAGVAFIMEKKKVIHLFNHSLPLLRL